MHIKMQSATSPARAAAALKKTVGVVLDFVKKSLPARCLLVNGFAVLVGWFAAAWVHGGAR